MPRGPTPVFAFWRGIYRMAERPWLIGGLAFLWGFFFQLHLPSGGQNRKRRVDSLPAKGTALSALSHEPVAGGQGGASMTVSSVDVLGLSIEAYITRVDHRVPHGGIDRFRGMQRHLRGQCPFAESHLPGTGVPGGPPPFGPPVRRWSFACACPPGSWGRGFPASSRLPTSGPLSADSPKRKGTGRSSWEGEPGLAEDARSKTLERFPAVQIVGTHHGYVASASEEVLSLVNDARPPRALAGPRRTPSRPFGPTPYGTV